MIKLRPPPRRLTRVMRVAPRLAATVAVALGATALVGWLLGLRALTHVLPGSPVMPPTTALLSVVSGVGLWLVTPPSSSPARRRASRIVAGAVVLVSVATLL